MAEHAYDVAVIGSGALACLAAGLLASKQARSTVLVTTPPAAFRLPRELSLGLFPMTRPERARALLSARAETLALAAEFGKGALLGEDVSFLARNPGDLDGLGHFRHLMRSFGESVEPLLARGTDRPIGVRARNLALGAPTRFEMAASDWADRAGVRRLDARETAVALKRDGSCRLTYAGITTEAAQAVLLSDDAILALAPPDSLDKVLEIRPREAALLSAPGLRLRSPVQVDLETGLTLFGQRGSYLALTDGRFGLDQSLAKAITDATGLDILSHARFDAVISRDGAPYFGHLKNSRTLLTTALGPMAAFLAPLVARWVAGTLTEAEAPLIEAAGGHRGGLRPTLIDLGAGAA